MLCRRDPSSPQEIPLRRQYSRPRRHRRQGFTLMELLITIGITLVLLGILFAAMSAVGRSSGDNRTRMVLQACAAAAIEYEAQTGAPINHPATTSPIDWTTSKAKNAPGSTGTGIPDSSIERFVWAALDNPAVKTVIEGVGKQALVDKDGDGFLEVIDGWENALEYAGADSASTVLPKRTTHYIASAGRDGSFTTDEDNRYSYEIK